MLRKRNAFKPSVKPASIETTTPALAAVAQETTITTDNKAEVARANTIHSAPSTSSKQSDEIPKGLSSIKSPTKSTATTSTTSKETTLPKTTTSTALATTTATTRASTNSPQASSDNNNDETIAQAIAWLKGQKSEPIKLQSMRYSANKNVKLKDLLFVNPPLTKNQKKHKRDVKSKEKSSSTVSTNTAVQNTSATGNEIETNTNSSSSLLSPKTANGTFDGNTNTTATKLADNDDDNSKSTQQQGLMPQVKLGPCGKLILDEGSTVINRRNSLKDQQAIIEDNDDIVSSTNYDSFRRKPANLGQSKWSENDTKKFYQALTLVGTDFSLMECLIFSGVRSRAELHKKFKREERLNKMKIDIALKKTIKIGSKDLSKIAIDALNEQVVSKT